MVWFHGGDYRLAVGLAQRVRRHADVQARGDVVLVTVNHRLNAFGFLYLADMLPEFADAANVGMLDLVAALKWVRDNIAEFGGDPGNVTIFGQSGGGGKVATMMAMPDGKGLFHRAIIQSGTYARNAHLEAMSPDVATAAHTACSRRSRSHLRTPQETDRDADGRAGRRRRKAGPLKPAVWRRWPTARTLPSGPRWPKAPAISADMPLMIGTTETEMRC